MPPRALAALLHRHSREDEYSFVLEGRVGALLGDEVVYGGPGDLIFKPRGQWHTFWNAGDDAARLLEIISPAGFERYFEEESSSCEEARLHRERWQTSPRGSVSRSTSPASRSSRRVRLTTPRRGAVVVGNTRDVAEQTEQPVVRVLAGSCECGAVRYRVADAFRYAMNCHAPAAAPPTGRRSSPWPGSSGSSSKLTAGADDLLVHGEDDLNDTRCAACGSLLYSVVRDGAYVHVALGSLVDAPSIRPTHHIFVGSKAPWFEITDDLPQFDEHAG